jgi:hypothetical protein
LEVLKPKSFRTADHEAAVASPWRSAAMRSARKTRKSLALMHQDDPRAIVVYRAVPPLLQKAR